MKSGKPRKAPKIATPSKKHPNVMKESNDRPKRKSPMAPMTGKNYQNDKKGN